MKIRVLMLIVVIVAVSVNAWWWSVDAVLIASWVSTVSLGFAQHSRCGQLM